jgi:hypothetical protein
MHFRRAALAAALLAPTSGVAQSSKFGQPFAPILLLLPSDPRALAMGNTGVASRDDAVLFFNPAQLAIARGFSGSFEHYSSTAAGGTLSAVTRFSTGGIAVGMRMVDYEMPDEVFPANPGSMLPAGPAFGTSLEASVGLAQVIKGVRIGGAAKYVEDNVPTTRVSRAAFDVGLSKDFFRFYTVGLAVQNIGKSMTIPCSFKAESVTDCTVPPSPPGGSSPLFTTANLPLRTTLGVAAGRPLGELDVVATAAVSMIRTDFVSPSGGVEVGYSWLDGYSVAVRGGARRPFPGETPFTAGAGFTMDRLSIDYAVEALHATQFSNLGAAQTTTHIAHRIGLRIR